MTINPDDYDTVEELLAALEAAKGDKKRNKTVKPSTRPYPVEKDFVSCWYLNPHGLAHTAYTKRSPLVDSVLHLYGPDIPVGPAIGSDKRMLDSAIVVIHSHRWNEPCSPAPLQQDCRVVKERYPTRTGDTSQ